jgi:hypothetical protein
VLVCLCASVLVRTCVCLDVGVSFCVRVSVYESPGRAMHVGTHLHRRSRMHWRIITRTFTRVQVKEISQLKRDKERLEHEVQALRAEQMDFATGDGTYSLNNLIDEERRRFKQALAQERARSAQALEKQQQELQRELQLAKEHASKEASRMVLQNALNGGADNTQVCVLFFFKKKK